MQIVLVIISALLTVSVFLSLIRNDYWLFKIFEYPRLQKLVLVVLGIGLWAGFGKLNQWYDWASFIGLLLSAIYLAYKIFPYTVFTKKEMKDLPSGDLNNELKVFAANVYQDNTEYGRLLNQVQTTRPDLILLLETNQAWAEALSSLDQEYPYSLKEPLENTYGLLFYSRWPFKNAKVNYLVKNDIPSVEAQVKLPSGKYIQIWGLHPEPPVPGENLYATAKDKELMKIALKARDSALPSIVFGDLNDVAWSHTTELFRKTSQLLDPRRGRGFFSTFSAHSNFIRFPLDYIFCSPDFGLVSMKRLPKNGSDHFSILVHLRYQPELELVQKPATADNRETAEAKEKANQPVEQ